MGRHQTGHNSGVVHAGIYYKPGSEKSLLCRRGVTLLREFCERAAVPYDECGKLVVAKSRDEVHGLGLLYERGISAGVPGLAMMGPRELRDIEPHVIGHAALHSPTTAIVDYKLVADALCQDVRSRGGEVATGIEVAAIRESLGSVVVGSAHGTWSADSVVICAGLQSDRLSRAAGGDVDPKILPFRGEYLHLREQRRNLIRSLVYPVPDPRYPFLGVHFTRRISGDVDVGPNAVLAFAREGYRWNDLVGKDLTEMMFLAGALANGENPLADRSARSRGLPEYPQVRPGGATVRPRVDPSGSRPQVLWRSCAGRGPDGTTRRRLRPDPTGSNPLGAERAVARGDLSPRHR